MLFYNWKHSRLFAGGGNGYSTTSDSLVFRPTADVRMCITVETLVLDQFEDYKLFFANLELASYAPRINIEPSVTTILIFDDASKL